MTTELRLWLSKRKDKLVELLEQNKAAELISMCPVELREDMYQLLFELYTDPEVEFDDITLGEAPNDDSWYGINSYSFVQGMNLSWKDAKYVSVKKAKNGVYPLTLVTGLARGLRGIVFNSQKDAFLFVDKLRKYEPSWAALPYKIPARAVRDDYVEIETPIGKAYICAEGKEKLDTVQHTPSKELADNNIRKKQTALAEKLLPEDFIKDELDKLFPEQDVHSFTKGPGIHYDEYHLQISWRTGMIELGDEVVIDAITKICNNNVKYTHKYSSTYIFKWAGTVREQLNDLAIEIYKKYGVEDQDYNDSLLARGIFN